MRRLAKIVLGLMIATGTATAKDQSPLTALAAKIPREAGGFISLIDVAAARGQTLPMALFSGSRNPEIQPYMHLGTMSGLPLHVLIGKKEQMPEEMGFSLNSIERIATWGQAPRDRTLLEGETFDETTIDQSLSARGFERKDDVWFRGEDLAIDIKRARDGIFAQVGKSSRFALVGQSLYHAPTWKGIEVVTADSPRLTDNRDAAALLSALERSDIPGPMIQINLMPRSIQAKGVFPTFNRIAAVLWQQGPVLTGGLALVYRHEDDARNAVALLIANTELPLPAGGGKSLSELFGSSPNAEVIETGGRHVAILSFAQKINVTEGNLAKQLRRNAHRRIVNMIFTGDLDTFLNAE